MHTLVRRPQKQVYMQLDFHIVISREYFIKMFSSRIQMVLCVLRNASYFWTTRYIIPGPYFNMQCHLAIITYVLRISRSCDSLNIMNINYELTKIR